MYRKILITMVTAALSTIPAVTAKTAMAKVPFLGWYENQKLYRHFAGMLQHRRTMAAT
jgi:uncharacterized membrane protein